MRTGNEIKVRGLFWYDLTDDPDYLGKFSIGVVGSRMMMELLWRIGVGCIKYIGDFITPVDVQLDVSLKPLEANDYDVVHSIGETTILSYLYTNDYKEMKKQLKGVDAIVAHKHIDLSAKIAEELGVPFIPNIITTFLPDDISFFEVEMPKVELNPLSYSLTCSIQACEILKLLTGYDMPILAPDAYVIDLRHKGYLKKIKLRLKLK